MLIIILEKYKYEKIIQLNYDQKNMRCFQLYTIFSIFPQLKKARIRLR